MPKPTKKLLVYLDQNFISEIAKRDLNTNVKPEFTDLYEILKTGFIEEKLVVPQSHFHDIETSLAPILKALIVKYQNHVGQISLYSLCRQPSREAGPTYRPLEVRGATRNNSARDYLRGVDVY